jgi:hypothetical protein
MTLNMGVLYESHAREEWGASNLQLLERMCWMSKSYFDVECVAIILILDTLQLF